MHINTSLDKNLTSQFIGYSKHTFKFLIDLGKNNNVSWFNANRSAYDKYNVNPS